MATHSPTVVVKAELPSGELVRGQLVRALSEAGTPLSTADLRERLVSHLDPRIVNEFVYRNLVVLERRGQVVRLPREGRHTSWTNREARDGQQS